MATGTGRSPLGVIGPLLVALPLLLLGCGIPGEAGAGGAPAAAMSATASCATSAVTASSATVGDGTAPGAAGAVTPTLPRRTPTITAPQPVPRTGGQATSSYGVGRDLGEMVHGGGGLDAGPDLVIQGRVSGATAPQDSGWPGRGPAPTFTDFTVQVSEVVAIGGAAPPAQVTVRMMGGTLDGFPPLEVGQEYLLFLRQWFELGSVDEFPVHSRLDSGVP